MTITAKFSNGHTDTYKGRRAVKAAWMVVTPTGAIHSGHSQDRATAEKTARGNAAYYSGIETLTRRGAWNVNYLAYAGKVAREAGFKSIQEHDADAMKRRTAYVANCKIEIVDL